MIKVKVIKNIKIFILDILINVKNLYISYSALFFILKFNFFYRGIYIKKIINYFFYINSSGIQIFNAQNKNYYPISSLLLNRFLLLIIINCFCMSNLAYCTDFPQTQGIIEYDPEKARNSNIFTLRLPPLSRRYIDIDDVWGHFFTLKRQFNRTINDAHSLENRYPFLESIVPINVTADEIGNNLSQFHNHLTNANFPVPRFYDARCVSLERYLLNKNYEDFISISKPLAQNMINDLTSQADEFTVNCYKILYTNNFYNIKNIVSIYNYYTQYIGPIDSNLANALDLNYCMNWGYISNTLGLSWEIIDEVGRDIYSISNSDSDYETEDESEYGYGSENESIFDS